MSSIRPVVQSVYRMLPPTIHPMILHFPIALLYLTAGIDILATITADRDRFLQRAGFWTLSLAAFFTILTMAAGAVSEHALHLPPAARLLLGRHKAFAVLTGAAEGTAWLIRVFSRYASRDGWSLFGTGRGRGGWFSTAVVVAAAVSITVTASIGGRLVYDHGAGVLGVTRGVTQVVPPAVPQGAVPQGAVPQGAAPQGAVPQAAVPQAAAGGA